MQSQGIEFDKGVFERNNDSDSLHRALKVALARKLMRVADL